MQHAQHTSVWLAVALHMLLSYPADLHLSARLSRHAMLRHAPLLA